MIIITIIITFDKFDLLALNIYVDDLIPTGNLKKLIAQCKKKLASEFEMKANGRLQFFWIKGMVDCRGSLP